MTTYECTPGFLREYGRLDRSQQAQFKAAAKVLAADLNDNRPPSRRLRVRKFNRTRGGADWRELTWAPNGRAFFLYGEPVKAGHQHVVWLRIGKHAVFDNNRH